MRAEAVVAMASYNRWMNERLYAICAEIPDEERKRDRKAFFGSIHRTLDHLLLVDKVWVGRFVGEPFQAKGFGQQLFEDFAALRAEREAMDRRIETWASGLSDATLASELRFRSMLRPGLLSCPLWVAVMHLFNHQAHHRGQLTTLLAQMGIDYGVTDFIAMPGMLSVTEEAQ